jgi:dCTP deaminase
MFLSDTDIAKAVEDGSITIKDFDRARLQPVSYDVLLGNKFIITDSHSTTAIDPAKKIYAQTKEIIIEDGESFVLHPHMSVLGTLKDYVGSNEYLIQLSGKSSLARIGLVIHNTAGIVNPGHFLYMTLELANFNTVPIILRPGMAIAQFTFSKLTSPVSHDYTETGRFNGDNWKKNFTPPKE